MKKYSVALILALRLLVVTSTVAQAAAPLVAAGLDDAVEEIRTDTLAGTASPLPSGSSVESDAPPLPSSFYGTVTLDGAAVPAGTPIAAWVGGLKVAETLTTLAGSNSVFVLDVPGDRPATPEVEGGREGQPILFRVGGYAAAQIALWRSGTVTPLNLTAIAWDGADLVLLKDDGQTAAASGEVLTYTLAVVNVGNRGATGVALADTLPAHVAFLAASDGGSEAGGVVAWPTFDLAAGESAVRTVTVRTEEPLPAGVGGITNTATVTDDGVSGPDPTPGNNVARDGDEVTAVAELTFNGARLTQCAPDRVVLPAVRDFLVASVREVEQGCRRGILPTGARDRLASAVRALVNEFIGDPALTAAYDLNGVAGAIESHSGCGDLASDLEALRVTFVNLRLQTCALAHHGVSAAFSPGATYTLVGRPVTYTLVIANRGTLSTTYETNLRIDESANLEWQITEHATRTTLLPGATFSTTVVVIPTAVGAFTLRADIAAQEAPIVRTQASTAPLDTLSVLHIITPELSA